MPEQTETTARVAVSSAPTNGPMDDAQAWHSIDWAKAEASVRRLRQRIFKAAQEGDLAKVRNVQKLMLRSHSNTLVSVKRVAQTSTGRRTAGVDQETALTSRERGRMWRRSPPIRCIWVPVQSGACTSPRRMGSSAH